MSSQNSNQDCTQFQDLTVRPSGEMFSFDLVLAKAYGIPAALIIRHFQFWIRFNRSKGSNFIDERTWTFQTYKEIAENIKCLNMQEVKYHIEKLVRKGVILKNNFNRFAIDKTCWYSFRDEDKYVPYLEDEKRAKSIDSGKPTSIAENRYPASENRRAIPETKIQESLNTKTTTEKKPPFKKHLPEKGSNNNNNKKNVPHKKPPKISVVVFSSLKDIQISEDEKVYLSKNYTEERVKLAIEFSQSQEIKTTLAQVLKWHCKQAEPPKPTLTPERLVELNKQIAHKALANVKAPEEVKIEILNQYVSIFHTQSCGSGHSILYTDKQFDKTLKNIMEKYQCIPTINNSLSNLPCRL